MAPGCTSEASVGRAATSDSGSLDSGSLDNGSLDSGSLVADAAPPLDADEYAKMVLIISAHMEIADPQVARLSKDTRALLGGIWAARARSEMGAGSGFERVPIPRIAARRIRFVPLCTGLASEAAES